MSPCFSRSNWIAPAIAFAGAAPELSLIVNRRTPSVAGRPASGCCASSRWMPRTCGRAHPASRDPAETLDIARCEMLFLSSSVVRSLVVPFCHFLSPVTDGTTGRSRPGCKSRAGRVCVAWIGIEVPGPSGVQADKRACAGNQQVGNYSCTRNAPGAFKPARAGDGPCGLDGLQFRQLKGASPEAGTGTSTPGANGGISRTIGHDTYYRAGSATGRRQGEVS